MIQLPNDAKSAGYKETRPFHMEQVFSSASNNFTGTELEFVSAGLAYHYTQATDFVRILCND